MKVGVIGIEFTVHHSNMVVDLLVTMATLSEFRLTAADIELTVLSCTYSLNTHYTHLSYVIHDGVVWAVFAFVSLLKKRFSLCGFGG